MCDVSPTSEWLTGKRACCYDTIRTRLWICGLFHVLMSAETVLLARNWGRSCWDLRRCQTSPLHRCARVWWSLAEGLLSLEVVWIVIPVVASHLTLCSLWNLNCALTLMPFLNYAALLPLPIPAILPFIPCQATNLYFMRVSGSRTFFSSVQ